jgi:hypothetical protein
MATELYVVKHHGAWRIRVDGKHHGEYPSRETAVRAGVVQLAWCKRKRLGQDARSSVRVSSVNSAMSGRQGAAHNGHSWLSTPI